MKNWHDSCSITVKTQDAAGGRPKGSGCVGRGRTRNHTNKFPEPGFQNNTNTFRERKEMLKKKTMRMLTPGPRICGRTWPDLPKAGLALSLLLFILLLATTARAATSGPNNPSAGANDASVGTLAWTTPTNVYTSNDGRATAALTNPPTTTQYLVATGFNFALPADSLIQGIQVSIERSATIAASARDNSVKIVKGGTATGTDKASASSWPTTDAYASYGSTSDLWGTTWTAADINAANFGVAISAIRTANSPTVRVDHITVTVTYCAPTGSVTVNAGQSAYGSPYNAASLISSASGVNSLQYKVTRSGAATVKYSMIKNTGTTVATGITTNWSTACSSNLSATVTTLAAKNGTADCNERVQLAANGTFFQAYSNTAYTVDTLVQGRASGNLFHIQNTSGTSTATYTLTLFRVTAAGTETALGSASYTLAANGNMDYDFNLSAISGTVPAGSKLGFRIAKTGGTSTSIRAYVGPTNNTAANGESGYVTVDESFTQTCTDWTNSASIPATAAGGSTCGDYTDGSAYTIEVKGLDDVCGTTVLSTPAARNFTWFANTLTVGNGSNPGNSTVAPGSASTDLNAFTLKTVNGTDTVSAVTVNLATTSGVATISITSDNGSVVYGTAAPGAQPQTIALSSNITATSTQTQYKVRITPLGHGGMPAVPGGSYAVSGTVTAVTSSLDKIYADSGSATITIDNLSPSNPTGLAATPTSNSVPLTWTNPGSDFASVVLLRRAGSAVASTPVEGTVYTAGNALGSSTVIYAGSAASYTDSSAAYGVSYYYKIYARDASGNYSNGGLAAGPYSITCVDGSPTTTVTVPGGQTVSGAAVNLAALFTKNGGSNGANPTFTINGSTVTSPWNSTAFGNGTAETVTLQVTVTDPDCGGYPVSGSGTVSVDNRLDAISVGAASATATAPTQIDVSWPFTHDKNGNATATSRYRTAAGPGAWSAPAAMTRGASAFTVSISGLAGNTGYDVEVTVADPNGVTGSNPQTRNATTPAADGGPPATVTDLAVLAEPNLGHYYLTLRWTAPGDDPDRSGRATSYSVRYSKKPIVESGATASQTNWSDATVVSSPPSPQLGGSTEFFYVFGNPPTAPLAPNTTYYFAVKATDELGQTSAISSNPAITFTDTAVDSPPYNPTGSAYGKTGLKKGWNLASAPFNPPGGSNTYAAAFTDDTGSSLMYHWTSTTVAPATDQTAANSQGTYTAATTVTAGRGVILYSNYSNRITDAPASSTAVSTTPTVFNLLPGWNLIGNPYLRPVTLSNSTVGGSAYSVAVGAGNIGNALQEWNGTAYVSTPWNTALLEPWKAYWLFSKNATTLSVPKP